MKKRFTNKIWEGISFLIVPIPLYLPFALKEYIDMVEYVMMGVVFALQLLVIIVFFLTKPKWSDWILKQANKMKMSEAIDDESLVDTAISAFLFYVMLVFDLFLPYLLYIDRPIEISLMFMALFFATNIWQDIFSSPLYQVLTNGSNPQKRWRRITPISLIALLGELFFHISPFDATITTCMLVGIFCLEVPFLLCLRAYKNKKNAT